MKSTFVLGTAVFGATVLGMLSLSDSLAGEQRKISRPPASPMLDGRCDDQAVLAREKYEVVEGIDIYWSQDEDYVWICHTIPPGARSWLDLYLEAPGIEEPINLHVSAQLGEWPADEEGPDGPRSDEWWQVHGWTATTARFNGYQGEGENRRVHFLPSEGREMQLSKEHFGIGEWKMQFTLGQGLVYPPDVGEGRELVTIRVR